MQGVGYANANIDPWFGSSATKWHGTNSSNVNLAKTKYPSKFMAAGTSAKDFDWTLALYKSYTKMVINF